MDKNNGIKRTTSLVGSFHHALNGLRMLLRSERNFKIHTLALLILIVFCVALRPSVNELCVLAVVSSMVLITEAVNTALESLCDAITTDFNPRIKKAKDVAAGAVFISVCCAVLVGLLIFVPYLNDCLFFVIPSPENH